MIRGKRLLYVLALVTVMLLVVACGGDGGPAAPAEDGNGDTGGEQEEAPAETGDTEDGDERDYFKVGALTSLSGEIVFGGNVTRRGYDLWEEQVNQQGGIEVDGQQYEVEITYADAQSDPQSAAEAAERMITQEDVDFILGPYASSTTLGAAPIVERHEVPMITGSAESPDIWLEGHEFTFGTIPAVNLIAPTALNTLVEQHDIETISIIGVTDPFSEAGAESFQATAEENDLEILSYDLTPTEADFTPLVSKAQSLEPDVLAIAGEPNDHIDFVQAMESLGYNPPGLVMHYGINTPDFLQSTGEWGNYVIGATVWDPTVPFEDDLFGTAEEYYETAEARYGSVPDYTQAASSATGLAFSTALQEEGLTPPLSAEDKQVLRDALEQVDVETFFGPINFETEGDWYHNNTGLQTLGTQMIDGEQAIVGPGDLGTQEIVYPRPDIN